MSASARPGLAGLLRWAVRAVALLAALISSLGSGPDLDQALLPMLALMAGSSAAAMALRRANGSGMIRIAPAFVVAAFLGLPPPAGVWVGVAAILVHSGALSGFTAGSHSNRLAGTAGLIATWGAATIGHDASLWPLAGGPVLYTVLTGATLAGCWLIGGLEQATNGGEEPPSPGQSIAELLNIPLAWILASFLEPAPRIIPLVLVSAFLVLASWVLRRLALVRGELRQANDTLAARVSELATLHSIGREIVSTLDLNKVYLIVERECRKILDVSRFSISLSGPADGGLECVYCHTRGEAGHGPATVHRLEKKVAAEKRAALTGSEPPSDRTGYPSAMAVPLIVEDRVIGVLMVRSILPDAYDVHGLTVLTTIAQQAAVAIENARNYRMATVDSLTGASLRDYFFKRVAEEFNRASRYRGRFALLMLDLDRFKSINDSFGHQAGDRYLHRLGGVIRSILRTADLACRYGGDEFCILLPETGDSGACAIAERLRGAVAGIEIGLDGERISTTASVGVAVFPDHRARDASELLKWADQAMYLAKRRGRDQVVLYEDGRRLQKINRRREPGGPIARRAGGNAR